MSKQAFGQLPVWYRQLEDFFDQFKDFTLTYDRAWGFADIWHHRSRIARWCGGREEIFRDGEFFPLDKDGLSLYVYQRIGKSRPPMYAERAKKGRSKRAKIGERTPLETATERLGWK